MWAWRLPVLAGNLGSHGSVIQDYIWECEGGVNMFPRNAERLLTPVSQYHIPGNENLRTYRTNVSHNGIFECSKW
jgi:hypothetical protein